MPYAAPGGASSAEAISYPSAGALGHIMTALTGLVDADAVRHRIYEKQH
jgi:hypothetical protein